jgi:enoyl-[acyl-carrier protein] reductase I
MPDFDPAKPLAGRKALVVGIANEQSIAWGCARAYRALGADLAVTYLNEKAERWVRPLAEQLGAEILLPMDVQKPGEMEEVWHLSVQDHAPELRKRQT